MGKYHQCGIYDGPGELKQKDTKTRRRGDKETVKSSTFSLSPLLLVSVSCPDPGPGQLRQTAVGLGLATIGSIGKPTIGGATGSPWGRFS